MRKDTSVLEEGHGTDVLFEFQGISVGLRGLVPDFDPSPRLDKVISHEVDQVRIDLVGKRTLDALRMRGFGGTLDESEVPLVCSTSTSQMQ